MHQVAELALLGHAKDLFELPSNADLRRLVARRLGPHRNPVVLRPHVHDDAADLVSLVKLLSNAREHGVQPVCIEQLGVPLGQNRRPLATMLAGRVLPLGLDALLEQVQVGHVGEPRRRDDVVIQAPEILHGVKGVHGAERLAPLRLGLLLLAVRVVKPQGPFRLQGMLLREIRLRSRGLQLFVRHFGRHVYLTTTLLSTVSFRIFESRRPEVTTSRPRPPPPSS
mmetsp:Transcript_10376/g.28296  ORF Transcript_10376/g.28296 Transcript_10376/m.28296 type:complete len:225 (-) Transcript_10376:525-1199(-)